MSNINDNVLLIEDLDNLEGGQLNSILPILGTSKYMTNDFIRDYRKIINDYTGNSGIYYFINYSNPNLSYIGSSNNLGRRLEEYWRVMRGVKKANNPFTKFLNKNSNWSVVILDLCHPSELRLYEQDKANLSIQS